MTVTTTKRPQIAARRAGYVIAALINGVLLYLVNVRPGWQAVPFLTEDTRLVIGLVNISIFANIAVNVVYLFFDRPWWKAAGDLLTTGIGVAVLIRMWQVFPFDFTGSSFDWALVARVVLLIAMAGAAVSMLVQFGLLIRELGRNDDDHA